VEFAQKLQIPKPGTIAILDQPESSDLQLSPGLIVDDPAIASCVLVFVRTAADLNTPSANAAVEAARRDAVAWVAYPKAGQLNTDLNRDKLAALVGSQGIRPVRQVAIDDVWSALRFRPIPRD
jgi:hypothetical protein